jgi:ABC-type Fe3+ transport system permease subunit
MIIGYLIHQLPLGVRNSEAGLLQITPELEEAAGVCGDSPMGVFYRITGPLLRRPLLATFAIAFIVLYRDLAISIFLFTPATLVSAVVLLAIYDNGSLPATCAYAVIMALISAAAVWVVLLTGTRSTHGAAQLGG